MQSNGGNNEFILHYHGVVLPRCVMQHNLQLFILLNNLLPVLNLCLLGSPQRAASSFRLLLGKLYLSMSHSSFGCI